jgi:hypothetical protein
VSRLHDYKGEDFIIVLVEESGGEGKGGPGMFKNLGGKV